MPAFFLQRSPRMKSNDPDVSRQLAAAAAARAHGRTGEADALLAGVLRLAPGHPVASNALGLSALSGGDAAVAAEHFANATAADPGASALWMNLAKAKRLLRDDEGERAALQQALNLDQRDLMALIRMAELNERLGEHASAMRNWTGVLTLGRQISQRPAELDEILRHAGAYLAERNKDFAQIIEQGLEAGRVGVAAPERRRFDACIEHALGRRQFYVNHCEGVHYPFLPADEFFDRTHFPWLAALESQTEVIRAELDGLAAAGHPGFAPYVAMDKGVPQSKWTPLDHSSDWSALHLWRYGERMADACALAPRTAAIMETLPLADMPARAPTVFFSLLRPGTRIPPHTGVSNTRAIVHLPLVVPLNCGLRVGGETREWRAGEAFVFDDTIEHEAWNDSAEPRVVLIFDVWNPHLTETERGLLRTFFKAADASGHDPGRHASVSDAR